MTTRLRTVDNVTPANSTENLDTGSDCLFDFAGPFFISFACWTTTANVLAGAFVLHINWTDPSGNSQSFDSTPITLGALGVLAGAYYSSPVFVVYRQSNSSTFQFVTELQGLASTSKVSYRLTIHPDSPGELQSF